MAIPSRQANYYCYLVILCPLSIPM